MVLQGRGAEQAVAMKRRERRNGYPLGFRYTTLPGLQTRRQDAAPDDTRRVSLSGELRVALGELARWWVMTQLELRRACR